MSGVSRQRPLRAQVCPGLGAPAERVLVASGCESPDAPALPWPLPRPPIALPPSRPYSHQDLGFHSWYGSTATGQARRARPHEAAAPPGTWAHSRSSSLGDRSRRPQNGLARARAGRRWTPGFSAKPRALSSLETGPPKPLSDSAAFSSFSPQLPSYANNGVFGGRTGSGLITPKSGSACGYC